MKTTKKTKRSLILPAELRKVALHYLDGVGGLVAESVKTKILAGKIEDACALKVDPRIYVNPHDYRRDAMAVSLFRKCDFGFVPKELIAKAEDSFLESESKCRETNIQVQRWVNWFEHGFYGGLEDLKWFESLSAMRQLVKDILRGLPRVLTPAFGPGSTFSDRGVDITIPHKLSSTIEVTPNAVGTEKFLYDTAWGRALLKAYPLRSAPRVVNGNRFTTVNKTLFERRAICIEPGGNIALQKALGSETRSRLRDNAGIDLVTGQESHRRLVKSSSVDKKFASKDLSKASDLISKMVPVLLIGAAPGWLNAFQALRSPATLFRGKWVTLEKFSSMGNGYTFELETLIFLVICRIATRDAGFDEGLVSVYGDDILVPDEASERVNLYLEKLGFVLNHLKSFDSNSCDFRESCGADYFNGLNVRPFFIKRIPEVPADWIVLANGIRRHHCFEGVWDNQKFLKAWLACIEQIPSDIRRIRGPSDYGDVLIHDERCHWQMRACRGHTWIRVYVPQATKVRLQRFHPEIQLAAALYGVPSSGAAVRDGISGYKKSWISYHNGAKYDIPVR